MRHALLPLIFLFTFSLTICRSQNDSLISQPRKDSFFKKAALPLGMIAGGSLLSQTDFELDFQKFVRRQTGDDFLYRADDYTRYIPYAQLAIANVVGLESKNHWFDQSKNLFIAGYATDWIVFKLKGMIFKRRPNGRFSNSFPSGHTSFSFTGASVLRHEYQDTAPIYGYSGYFFAATTGGFRIANNEHFISDVVVGAGIAMLITELVYYFDPIIPWNPFKKTGGVALFPSIDEDTYGFAFSMQF